MKPRKSLLLTRQQVASLLSLEECISTVEQAFRIQGRGRTIRPEMMHLDTAHGEFHIKGGGLVGERTYVAIKANGGFFRNAERFGLPAIQGVIILFDGENGYPLAILDSKEITMKRTGAATAVAAKHLARRGSRVVTICGCGIQGHIQLEAVKAVLPIERAYAYSIDPEEALRYSCEMTSSLGIPVLPAKDLPHALQQSDVCVTCTPSKRFFLEKDSVSPGTFISAIGADSPEKQEIDPHLLSANKVVVDLLTQCSKVGELHHVLSAGLPVSVHGELGDVVAGTIPGRESDQEIIVFDATGTALQDVASAAFVYERALERGVGESIDFFG